MTTPSDLGFGSLGVFRSGSLMTLVVITSVERENARPTAAGTGRFHTLLPK